MSEQDDTSNRDVPLSRAPKCIGCLSKQAEIERLRRQIERLRRQVRDMALIVKNTTPEDIGMVRVTYDDIDKMEASGEWWRFPDDEE